MFVISLLLMSREIISYGLNIKTKKASRCKCEAAKGSWIINQSLEKWMTNFPRSPALWAFR